MWEARDKERLNELEHDLMSLADAPLFKGHPMIPDFERSIDERRNLLRGRGVTLTRPQWRLERSQWHEERRQRGGRVMRKDLSESED